MSTRPSGNALPDSAPGETEHQVSRNPSHFVFDWLLPASADHPSCTGRRASTATNHHQTTQGVGGTPHGGDLAPRNMDLPTTTHSSQRAGSPHPQEQTNDSSTLPQSIGQQSSSDPSQARRRPVLKPQSGSAVEVYEYWDCCMPGCGEVGMLMTLYLSCANCHPRCSECPVYGLGPDGQRPDQASGAKKT